MFDLRGLRESRSRSLDMLVFAAAPGRLRDADGDGGPRLRAGRAQPRDPDHAGPGNPEGRRGRRRQGRLDAQLLPAADGRAARRAQPLPAVVRRRPRTGAVAAADQAVDRLCRPGRGLRRRLPPRERQVSLAAARPADGGLPEGPSGRRQVGGQGLRGPGREGASARSGGGWRRTGKGPGNPCAACSTTRRRRRSASAWRTARASRSSRSTRIFPSSWPPCRRPLPRDTGTTPATPT